MTPTRRHWAIPIACAAACAAPANAGPIEVRNQNPLLAPYGIPSALPARLPPPGAGRAGLMVNLANAADTETVGETSYTLDAEALELRLHLMRAIGERFAVSAELPWRQVSEGSLDSIVEDWHDLFGLSDGPRAVLPRDELLIEYSAGGTTELEFDQARSGIGDIPVALGYQLYATDRHAVSTWLSVKLPVGDAADLTGSGAVDVALSVAAQSEVADRWQVFGQLNAVSLGDGDLLPALQEDFAWSALAGVSWNAWRTLDLTVQVEANSSVFDESLTNLAGDAVLMTFGGSYVTGGGWRFLFAVSEDIEVRASPDVAFHFGVSRGF